MLKLYLENHSKQILNSFKNLSLPKFVMFICQKRVVGPLDLNPKSGFRPTAVSDLILLILM